MRMTAAFMMLDYAGSVPTWSSLAWDLLAPYLVRLLSVKRDIAGIFCQWQKDIPSDNRTSLMSLYSNSGVLDFSSLSYNRTRTTFNSHWNGQLAYLPQTGIKSCKAMARKSSCSSCSSCLRSSLCGLRTDFPTWRSNEDGATTCSNK